MDNTTAKTPFFLVTNDDGPHSPLLAPLCTALSSTSPSPELSVVIPAEERSWISQAASLRTLITASPFVLGNAGGFLISGTPADAVSIGIQNLLSKRPDFCISGINLGINAGMAFFHNSGTVGAARQAVLCGVPAVAVSAFLPSQIFNKWKAHDHEALAEHQEDWRRLATAAVAVLERLRTCIGRVPVDCFSINLPWEAHSRTEVSVTRLARVHYNHLFQETAPNSFELQPRFEVLSAEQPPLLTEAQQVESDIAALKAGKISVTPFSLDGVAIDPEELKKLQDLLLPGTSGVDTAVQDR